MGWRAGTPAPSNVDVSGEIRSDVTADLHAISRKFAKQFAATRGHLARVQHVLTEPCRPVWRQRAMRGACGRIFRNAHARCEEPRDEVDLFSWCGDDHAEC